jgi:hypothetical protein
VECEKSEIGFDNNDNFCEALRIFDYKRNEFFISIARMMISTVDVCHWRKI